MFKVIVIISLAGLLAFSKVQANKTNDIRFEHISIEQGLSQSTVECFLRDSKGFMWIGTQGGLNRYDGYNFKIFKPEVDNPNSLSHVFVSSLCEIISDSGRTLWIGTSGGGLNKFDISHAKFKHFRHNPNDQNSLSSDHITSIVAENNDILWIGTLGGGLNKLYLENEHIEKYCHNPNDSNSLCNNNIKSIFQDDSGFIWIGTEGGGLSCFNPKNEQFINFQNDPNDKPRLSNKYVYSNLYADKKGYLWIGTKAGLNRVNMSTLAPILEDVTEIHPVFKRYFHDPEDPSSLAGNWICSITEDHHGQLWIATYGGGLSRFDYDRECFINYGHDPANPNSLSSNDLLTLYDDYEGDALWVGTDGQGISKFTRRLKKITHYKNIPGNPNGLSQNTLYAVHEDHQGNIWLGSQSQGLDRYDPKANKFTHYRHDPMDPSDLPNNKIYAIFEDRLQRLWVGTAHGLAQYDAIQDKFINYLYNPQNPNDYLSPWIMDICQDPIFDEILWIATLYTGLIKLNIKEGSFICYLNEAANANSLGNNSINCLYADADTTNPILWIGTEGGLNRLDLTHGKFKHYKYDPDDPQSLSYNNIMSLYMDKAGALWIGTWGGGLNRFNKEKEIFTRYGEKDGLASEAILGMVEDDHGNLWICTMKGLAKFNPETEKFNNYDVKDGLHSNEYWRGCCKTKDGLMYFGGINGLDVFFPDSIKENQHIPNIVLSDFQIFNKSVIPDINAPLKSSISEINEIVLSYDQDIFSFAFSALDFTIPGKNHYAYKMEGVDPDWVYTDAKQRFATYTKLDPGDYVFQVKGSNNDGIWNENGTSIKVTILPPWWRTSWAYALYILSFLTLLAFTWYLQLKRIRIRHQLEIKHLHAEKLAEIDRIKSHFFANISHEFRTPLTLIEGPVKQLLNGELKGNVKQTYRLILRNTQRVLNLVNQLLDLSKLDSGKMRLQARKTNIVPLLKGLVQSFASLAEHKKIILKFIAPKSDIALYIDVEKFEKIINNLLSNAFKFTPEGGRVEVCIGDSYGNQKKGMKQKSSPIALGEGGPDFSGTGGVIDKSTPYPSPNPFPNIIGKGSNEMIQITISNTGPGIPPDQLDKIFDRFYQVNSSFTPWDNENQVIPSRGVGSHVHSRHRIYPTGQEGTGIGLALVKELVELHHGTIGVHSTGAEKQPPKSPFPKGDSSLTTFTILLPIGKELFKEGEIIATPLNPPFSRGEETSARPAEQLPDPLSGGDTGVGLSVRQNISRSKSTSDNTKLTLLIVEDHQDVRYYIESILVSSYRVLHAENGNKGLKIAKSTKLDLIISDVMMPGMDGYTFCKKIKTDQRTSHIPVILLTARAASEDRLKGLETGTDDYLVKPFESRELLIRVDNLIEQRRKLRERFAKELKVNPRDITVTSADEKFLSRLNDIVEREMSQSSLNVSYLAKEMGLSYIQLYRKTEALVGVSPAVFVRMLRLKRAQKLLKQNFGTVSQIAFEVGFNSVSYFSNCYSKQFGHTPSSILK